MNIKTFIILVYSILFCTTLSIIIISSLFGYYIYKSYENSEVSVQVTQDSLHNKQEVGNEK